MIMYVVDSARTRCLPTCQGLPIASRPYINVYAESSVTLSGPPVHLDDLLKFGYPPRSTSRKIRVRGPYHAPHLYEQSDLDQILHATSAIGIAPTPQKIPVIFSASNGLISSKIRGIASSSADRNLARTTTAGHIDRESGPSDDKEEDIAMYCVPCG